MKTLKKLSLITFILFAASLAAFSQDNGGKKDPPKKDEDKPKIVVKEKDKDKDKDKDKGSGRNNLDKPKKPQAEGSIGSNIVKAILG